MPVQNEPPPAHPSAEGGLISYIEQFDAPIDCPNLRVPYMIGVNQVTGNVILFRPRCKSWACPTCARANMYQWAHRANYGSHQLYDSGSKLSFVTITSSNKISAEQSWWVAPRAWMKLQARVRRATGGFQYFCVPEVQKRGHVHFHMISTTQLGKRWWKDNAAECGFGWEDDEKTVWQEAGVVGYVVKYLSKDIQIKDKPKGTRHVRTSRGWPKQPDKEPPKDWIFSLLPRNVSLVTAEKSWQNAGYNVVTLGSKTAWLYLDIHSSE